MNKLEVRWVILSITFAFLPLALLFEHHEISSEFQPLSTLFKDPLLFFAYAQLTVLGLNFLLLVAKSIAFKLFRIRNSISVLLIIMAFFPVYLAGQYSVPMAQEFLPENPLPFFVITIAMLGVSAMFMVRAMEIWNVPSSVLERLAKMRSSPMTSQA